MSRRSVHACRTAASTCEKDGMPPRGSGGKYVPAKNARPSGVVKTESGQPRLRVNALAAAR